MAHFPINFESVQFNVRLLFVMSSFESGNDIAGLHISDDSDSLQQVINGAYEADVRDGLVDGDANSNSSAGAGDCSSQPSESARASTSTDEPYSEASGGSTSLPGNQELRWRQFYARKTSMWHRTDDYALEKADRMVEDLSDSAKKIHDGYIGQGMQKHDFQPVADASLELDEYPEAGVTPPFFITVPELLLRSRDEFNRTFEVFGTTLDFVLVKRRADDYPWYIPPLSNFADVVNVLQNRILEKRFRFLDVLVETKSWCGVGVLSLKVTCPLRLARWREQLTRVDFEGYSYNSFPRDALQTKETQVSILLRAGLRYFDLKWLAHGLKLRNGLKGRMTVVYSKVYGPNDKTRGGISKNGWRLVVANVDQAFMESYNGFPVGYGYRLGSSTVQIRPLMSSPEPELPPLGVPPPPMSHFQVVQQQVQSRGLSHHGLQCASREVRFPPPDITNGSYVAPVAPEKKKTPSAKATTFPLIPEMVRTISAPVPLSQVRPKSGPGSRGGNGKKAQAARNNAIAAASAAAKKAYEAACEVVFP